MYTMLVRASSFFVPKNAKIIIRIVRTIAVRSSPPPRRSPKSPADVKKKKKYTFILWKCQSTVLRATLCVVGARVKIEKENFTKKKK